MRSHRFLAPLLGTVILAITAFFGAGAASAHPGHAHAHAPARVAAAPVQISPAVEETAVPAPSTAMGVEVVFEADALNRGALEAALKDAVHFEAVREDMAALLQAGRAKDLKDAYDMAVYANPQTRQALLEQQRQEALKQAQSAAIAARAKSAAVSVRGSSPASGSASAPTSLRAALEAAFNG